MVKEAIYVCTKGTISKGELESVFTNLTQDTIKKTLGDRAFSAAAPNLWNQLLADIRKQDNFNKFKNKGTDRENVVATFSGWNAIVILAIL